MGKQLKINTGTAILLKDPPEAYAEYDSIQFSAGNTLISRNVYNKLMKMGVSFNSGNINIIDVEGEVTELPGGSVITEVSSYKGCFLICDGNLIVEDKKGLDGIAGLYAECVLHPQSVNLDSVKGIISSSRVVYTDGAKLHIGDMTLSDDSHIVLNSNTLYWVHGNINALDGNEIEKLQRKSITFHCGCLTTYNSVYEKYSGMFNADTVKLIPDGYGVVWEADLDSGTAQLYGEKLYVLGDMMIAHDQAQHLSKFSSLIVKGTVTMPVSAAASFKAVGKADEYDLYEGILRKGNGKTTMSHDMLQSALNQGISYTIRANGDLLFTDDVTAEDIGAISSVGCNGRLIVSGTARGALDSKIKYMNGVIGSADELDKENEDDAGVTKINTGCLKF